MRIFVILNHPAHFHLFKNSINILQSNGHKCELFIRPKNVLKELLDSNGYKYTVISSSTIFRKHILVSSIFGLLKKSVVLFKYIFKKKPDLMIGTDWVITGLGRLFNIPSIIFNEDDTVATPENKVFYPLAKTLFLPEVCDKNMWVKKRISYSGNHELAYLHPNQFKYEKGLTEKEIGNDKPFIIIRLVKLTASHDIGKKGLGKRVLKEIISNAEEKFNILISFEGKVIEGFEKYQFKFNPNLMHQFLADASLVIGDSQTMIAEAAVLGTPAIRFNDFVGKLSYLDELENKYNLAYGFKTTQDEAFISKTNELLSKENLKNTWKERQNKFLNDKIDVTAFMVWFIENYPKSKKIMKETPDYQYKFR